MITLNQPLCMLTSRDPLMIFFSAVLPLSTLYIHTQAFCEQSQTNATLTLNMVGMCKAALNIFKLSFLKKKNHYHMFRVWTENTLWRKRIWNNYKKVLMKQPFHSVKQFKVVRILTITKVTDLKNKIRCRSVCGFSSKEILLL